MPKNTTKIIPVCLLTLAGGFAAQHNRVPIDSDYCAALFVAAFIIFFAHRVRWFAFLLLGFALFSQAGNEIIGARLEPRFAGDSLLARVRIADFPKATGASVALMIEPVDDARLPARSRVTWFEPATIPHIGEVWEFELRLRRPYGSSNPGLFSLQNWIFREKIGATGYVVSGKRNRRLSSASLSWLEEYRRSFVARATMAGEESAPVLAAVGVGARHLIPREQWERYAITGTSHLMAISGLHIGLAATAVFIVTVCLSGACRLRGNFLDHGIIAAAIFATFYATVSGFAVPSQRATLMLGLAACAFLMRRRARPGRIVAVVALLIFVADPVAIMAPGFSLSFAAVVTLFWTAKSAIGTNRDSGAVGKVVTGSRKLIAMQFSLLFGLMPLTILIFQRVAFIAPVANIATVPVFSFLTVPLVLASMVVQPVWAGASQALLRLAGASVQIVEWLIDGLASIPGAGVELSGIGGDETMYLFLVLLPALWVYLPRGWPGRWIAPLGVVALLLHSPADPPRNCIAAHVLDVGQGLAVVVQTRQRTLVFDTGASYRGGGSAAQQIVIPFLRFMGIDKIDWLVVSHADDDHAGGVATVMRDITVDQVLTGEPLPNLKTASSNCAVGQFWRVDGIEFHVLHPGRDSSMTGNDSSCVIAVRVGDQQLLMTGDIEAAAEQSLLDRSGTRSATVVLIPHHGSLTSSSPAFVNQTSPDLAIASAGYNNRWGFPKDRVVKRWEGVGATVLDTASSGAISFLLCPGDGISELRENRVRQRRFWHDSADL